MRHLIYGAGTKREISAFTAYIIITVVAAAANVYAAANDFIRPKYSLGT